MASLQRKAFRSIGITEQEAAELYNIVPIDERIDTICERTLRRILNDDEHHLHANLIKPERGSARPRRARGELYNESFLVKFMRRLRPRTRLLPPSPS